MTWTKATSLEELTFKSRMENINKLSHSMLGIFEGAGQKKKKNKQTLKTNKNQNGGEEQGGQSEGLAVLTRHQCSFT